MENYIEKNKDAWNQKTPVHIASEFYDMVGFMKGKSSLNEIELHLLGDIKGKSILHLQCHFGQDTLSLARMGAQVTGVDLSDKAIEKASQLAKDLDLDARFICCNIYDLPAHLNETFDIVYTSYGTIGWLPDLEPWGKLIAQFLKPAGKFVFVEFHPVMWMYDNDFTHVAYSYFKADPIIEITEGTYADTAAPLQTETISWNHSLGEVLSVLIKQGLHITDFQEYDYSPYKLHHMEAIEENRYVISQFGPKVPLVFSVCAKKS